MPGLRGPWVVGAVADEALVALPVCLARGVLAPALVLVLALVRRKAWRSVGCHAFSGTSLGLDALDALLAAARVPKSPPALSMLLQALVPVALCVLLDALVRGPCLPVTAICDLAVVVLEALLAFGFVGGKVVEVIASVAPLEVTTVPLEVSAAG